MKTRLVLGLSTLAIATGLALGLSPQDATARKEKPAPTLAAQNSASTTFAVDNVHSSMMFKINHMGVSNFLGRFNEITGTYTLDPTTPTFDIRVPTASIDTHNADRDKHLKSPDFFNATEFQHVTFKSTSAQKTGENAWNITGDLSLHGVTKPITAAVKVFPAKSTQHGNKSGFEATFSFKRSDYGMTNYITEGALGDHVDVTVGVEGASK